ncbi:MAG TPA: hypothetical protein PLP82_04020 [Deltaproteobacteria bacterium]|jgi:hypothetical protein|nr:MAG: hypothetical protein BWX71_01686 [Deltaproteobacteria bacterium ADurb.Bin072]HNQ86523.1 hypothetical protein [Deltaproteobacteria bacterium]HRW80511.1 hypothetical protein [Desulfomonilia bacterium]HNS90643.1 hypothetical protein [Deltaproteobacteria bacterium]HOA44998.1 hypothetical protein [Deltaproteobacteria bacterium]
MTIIILELAALFIAGIITDLLVTRYTRSVAERKVWSATILSGMITFANFLLITLIIKEGSMQSFFGIAAYAGGNTVGTYVAMVKQAF